MTRKQRNDEPYLDLMSVESARRKMMGYIQSRAWWVFPNAHSEVLRWGVEIEERYYAGDANADFEIVVHPGQAVLSTSFARKRHMSAAQLAEILIEMGCAEDETTMAQTLMTQDIVIMLPATIPRTMRRHVLTAVTDWQNWLLGGE